MALFALEAPELYATLILLLGPAGLGPRGSSSSMLAPPVCILHIQFNGQKSPYQLMTRFGSEELVRYEGSLNRSSAWACEAVAGVERAIRALLSPPRRPCTARTAFNLATTRRCCVAVRAIVKPYVLGRTRKTQWSTRTFWAGTLVSLRMCHMRR